jgi:uncharacterized protein YndB with AHSA1/START domain
MCNDASCDLLPLLPTCTPVVSVLQPILDAIATFVQELRDGVPAKAGAAAAAGGGADADATSAAKPATPPAAAAAAVTAAAPTTGGAGATAAPAASSSGAGGSRSVSITQQFYASRTDLYECFTVQGRLVAFTRSPAVVDARPGGALSLFGGGVVGSYEQLVPGERLVLTWRFNSWEDGCTSRVRRGGTAQWRITGAAADGCCSFAHCMPCSPCTLHVAACGGICHECTPTCCARALLSGPACHMCCCCCRNPCYILRVGGAELC